MQLSTAVLVYFCFHYWSRNRVLYLAKYGRKLLDDKASSKKPSFLNKISKFSA